MKSEVLVEELKKHVENGTGLIVGIHSKSCNARKPSVYGTKCIGCVSEDGCNLLVQCMLIVSKGILCGTNPAFAMLEAMGVIQQKQAEMAYSPMAQKLNAMLQEER